MKTYWDYNEQERAALTEQQVNSLLDVELMEKGVLKPVAPTLIPIVEPKDIGERKQFYGVEFRGKYGSDEDSRMVFASMDEAKAFMALNPLVADYNYEAGSDYTYAMSLADAKITVKSLFCYEDINRVISLLKKNKSAVEENRSAESKYSEALRIASGVTDGVWKDWYDQRGTRGDMERVVSTYKEYLALTQGDSALALKFLGKVYNQAQIEKAQEWIPDMIPNIEAPKTESP